MCFSLFGCLVNLFLAVLVFVGVYLVLVLVVRAVREEDIDRALRGLENEWGIY